MGRAGQAQLYWRRISQSEIRNSAGADSNRRPIDCGVAGFSCFFCLFLLLCFRKRTKLSCYRNDMRFIDFQNQLSAYPVFSLQEVKKIFIDFSYRQLDRWEKKGYLKKIKKGFYCLTSQELNQNILFYTANKIYSPSYVSMEMALKYYGFIPEEIFQITSVSTKKTTNFETPVGNFNYKHIKPNLFWGYRLVDFGRQRILLAEPEKAVLDYLYIHPKLKATDDFLGMRINVDQFRTHINPDKFQKYLKTFNNKRLSKRANTFLTTILA
jgi:predicted transcriptional regulator of viral defense system